MPHIDSIKDQIAAINTRAGERFASTALALASRIDDAELHDWADITLEIAGSGWHAWETSNAWCDLSAPLFDASGYQALVHCGNYGISLCGFSFEPSATYFRGIEQLVESDLLDRAGAIETAGSAILTRYPHSSSLLTDYLRTAFSLASVSDFAHLNDWRDVTTDIAALSRDELIAFFEATRVAGDVDWRFVRAVAAVSVPASLEYMRVHRGLSKLLGGDEEGLKRNILRFAAGEAPLGPWFEALDKSLAPLDVRQRRLLISLLDRLPGIEVAQSLLGATTRLPFHRPEVMSEWIRGVDAYLPLNIAGARGFVALESATSVDLMQRLLGQVNLADCQRVLQLFSEAIAGTHLAIEEQKGEVDHFRNLPTTDGISIFLPESLSRYPDAADNFALYKMCLLHQLGYYEFGTFRYRYHDSLISFSDYFHSFRDASLARAIFQIVEDARVDWALARRYRGAAVELERFKADAREALAGAVTLSPRRELLNALARLSLDDDACEVSGELGQDLDVLAREIARVRQADADVFVTMDVVARCYEAIARHGVEESPELSASREPAQQKEEDVTPPDIDFRGKLEPDRVRINLQLANLEDEDVDFAEDSEDSMTLSFPVDPKNVTIEQLKRGDVQEALAMMITDLEGKAVDEEELTEEQKAALEEFRGRIAEQSTPTPELAYRYDEWDCVIEDYRRRWCTLYEIRNLEEHPEFVEQTLKELPAVARKVRRQLNNLKPELLRKVRGVVDGEDLDLERAVELLVDKLAGLAPEERIYIERLRKDRDVSALFLLDMSASTDDRIPEPVRPERAAPEWDKDDFLHDYYGAKSESDKRKRIIDLEKEAVVLMAEALEELGDSYSVCGFSGYGREQVDFYLCKDFMEPYNLRAKGRIGGMKPCRSTRMGPAIRHATKRLIATESRIKAMIIISDGYPQDFDYGKDRNSKDYGIKDTTMALTEARQKGVQAFCLTVDPSGHDYLREMCPDNQYMVIQDINQLPDELSKVYRSLTG